MPEQRPTQPVSSEADPQPEGQTDPPSLPLHIEYNRRKQRQQRRRSPLRASLAVTAGRTVGALSRRLHLGGGTSIMGIVAQGIYPQIVTHLATELEYGSVVITGTNGKTTTSSFIATILRNGGLRVWQNREGSNLMRGVASSLVIRSHLNGHLRRGGRAISILELDEAAVPQLVKAITPRVMVFTNLFRDQLDRYGEVDSVIGYWKRAIRMLPDSTVLVLNADDPSIASLATGFTGKVIFYGIEDPSLNLLTRQDQSEQHQVIDTRTCMQCGSEYAYDMRFYSHMGHYYCPNCGTRRPQTEIRVTQVKMDEFDRTRLRVETPTAQHEVVVPLPGLYNIYNALAAIAATLVLDVPWEPIATGIEQFKPMFGRGELIQAEGRTLRLLLAKNPTGFNEVLRTLFSDEVSRHVLFILNDNTADGRDISWIWDVDFERMVGQTQAVVVSGTRALDLALRLKYAGVEQEHMTIIPPYPLRAVRRVLSNGRDDRSTTANQSAGLATRSYGLKKALDSALQQTPAGETLFVVPTYTGLLEVHRELEQRGLTPHYWEGRDA